MPPTQLAQLYALQSYELAQLRRESEALRAENASLQAQLADATKGDVAELKGQIRSLRAVVSEHGMEVARLHMDDQRNQSKIRELEAALAAATRGGHAGGHPHGHPHPGASGAAHATGR